MLTRSFSLLLTITALGLCSCDSLLEDASAPDSSSLPVSQSAGESVRTQWWKVFHDPFLDQSMRELETENLSLRAGMARVEQAYAALGITEGDLYPSASGGGLIQRNRVSQNDAGGAFFPPYTTQYRASLGLSWEVDLWGRVRQAVRGAEAQATEAESLLAELRLSLQAQLARNYFAMRWLEEEERVLQRAVASRRKNLRLAKKRFQGEISSELDVARADAELAATEAELARIHAPYQQRKHAVAVLLGKAPAQFTPPRGELDFRLPSVRSGTTCKILEARPDIAAAAARLEQANAALGVAKAERLPRLDLVGAGGLSSISADDFLNWSSRTFTIGPEVSVPLFQGGRLQANVERTRAAQREALANYQQVVLTALQEVEDALADLDALRGERRAQLRAVAAADKAFRLSDKRYTEGLVSSIEVIDAVREQLNAQRRAVQLRSLQYDATVRLIQAVGGGQGKSFVK